MCAQEPRCLLSFPSRTSRPCTRALARARILAWALEKKGVFTLVPSEFCIWAPCPGTKCELTLSLLEIRISYPFARWGLLTKHNVPLKLSPAAVPDEAGEKKLDEWLAANIPSWGLLLVVTSFLLFSPFFLCSSSYFITNAYWKAYLAIGWENSGSTADRSTELKPVFVPSVGNCSKLPVYLSRCNINLEVDSKENIGLEGFWR